MTEAEVDKNLPSQAYFDRLFDFDAPVRFDSESMLSNDDVRTFLDRCLNRVAAAFTWNYWYHKCFAQPFLKDAVI